MKKLLISIGIGVLTIPSLCYYVTKYYIEKSLNFDESNIIFFTIICTLSVFGLIFNIYNARQNYKLNNQIIELKEIIKEYHYEELEFQQDNRELILDIDMEKE